MNWQFIETTGTLGKWKKAMDFKKYEKLLNLLTKRQMQIQGTMKCDFSSIQLAKIEKIVNPISTMVL